MKTDYDSMIETGWTYHRNGVGGCGFYCRIENDTLKVAFNVDDDTCTPTICAPLWMVRQMADRALSFVLPDITVRSAVADSAGIVVFDWHSVPGDVFVAITDLTAEPNRTCTAVFSIRMLEDENVAFGENSWRGDRVHRDVLAALV